MILSSPQRTQSSTPFLEQAGWYRAWTLRERLALRRSTNVPDQTHGEEHRAFASRLLERWRKQPPFSQEESLFAERLAWDGLSEEELLTVLAESSETLQQRSQTVPEWLRELEHILTTPAYFQTLASTIVVSEDTMSGGSNRLQKTSFLEVLTPFLARGTERLQAGIQELVASYPSAPFESETIQRIQRNSLANLLLFQISRTLTLELHVARLEGKLRGATPEDRFQQFTESLRDPENLQRLLEEYPSLARLLLTTLEHWLQFSLEFLHHLCTDWDEICQVMVPESDPEMLVEVQSGAGDMHKQGRSTLKLRFASGFRLIYKPKLLTIDVHFQQLLDWLNERGDHPAFRLLKLLPKETYGWSEYVQAEACASQEEVARFYERQGSYLALFYALEASDMHLENLIAAGEHPLMIDLEALFHPRIHDLQIQKTHQIGMETFDRSVLRVGLLPQRFWSKRDQTGIDLSGLAGAGGQLTPQPVLQAEAVGTDHMRFIRDRIAVPGANNLPQFEGSVPNVLDYRAQFIAGFTKMYRLLLSRRDELLNSTLLAFAQDEIRLIVRATQTYGQLFAESTHPDLLRDGLERDRFFDRLWVQAVANPSLKHLISAELQDLHDGDIPMFTTRPDTCDVYTSRGVRLPDFLAEPSLNSVSRRLRDFDEQDLLRQIWFIQGSLATIHPGTGHSSLQSSHPSLKLPDAVQGSEPLTTRLVKAAHAVGERLCDLALHSEHGTNWIGLAYVNEREWILTPTAADIYSGASGIALFLAYLGYITGTEKYTACARTALSYIRESSKALRGRMAALGGYDGWGSLIYLYSHLGALWQDQSLLVEAGQLVEFSADLVERDQAFDVISGSAGCIAGLLSLYQVTPGPEILHAARRCGERLLAAAPQCQNNTPELAASRSTSQPLTGISHGAAGITLNLLRLAEVSGEERFLQGAMTAMAYERQLYSPEHQNWPDFRVDVKQGKDQTTYDMFAWCHGAPGIGLARLASLPYCDDAAIRAEIEAAVKATLARGFGLNHSLCHGDLGNLETILTAARTLKDAYYQSEVEQKASALLDSIEQFGWQTGIPLGVESPGLMTGIAGIGYELLRLANPDQVPAILLLEPPLAMLERRSSSSTRRKHR